MTLNAPHDDTAEPSTVILKGQDELEYDDLPAGAAIRTGMLVDIHSEAQEVVPHGTAAGAARPAFAVEYRKYGMHAGNSTLPSMSSDTSDHDTYQLGDIVKYAEFDKGHRVYALLTAGVAVDATADNVPLVSNGDGTLRPINTNGATGETADSSVVEAIESVDNTAGTDGARIRVEVTT